MKIEEEIEVRLETRINNTRCVQIQEGRQGQCYLITEKFTQW